MTSSRPFADIARHSRPSIMLLLSAAVYSMLTTATPAATAIDDPLSGPKVKAPAEPEKSIIRRDASGALEPLDQRPEFAAVELLDLSAEQKASIAALRKHRAKAVSEALYEHMALFLEVQGARQARDMTALRQSMPAFRETHKALLAEPLSKQIGAILQPAQVEQFEKMLADYRRALEAARAGDEPRPNQGDAMPDRSARWRSPGRGESRSETRSVSLERYETNLLVREMAQTLSSIVKERSERADEMLKAIDATPEQAAKIRLILRGPQGDADRDQRMRSITEVLTPEQRTKLRAYFRGGSPGE